MDLRPTSIEQFTGQPRITMALRHAIDAAKARGEEVHHILLHGAPGLGKTSLACLIASEMGVNMRQTTGPSLQTISDLAVLVMSMKSHEVLFIDEVHALPRRVEEVLYNAMEDRFIDIVAGTSPKMPLRITLEEFTVVGATTRLAKVNQPLRDRFGKYHTFQLDYYDAPILSNILKSNVIKMNVSIPSEAIDEISSRGRGTPRIAIDLLAGVIDYAHAIKAPITKEIASSALMAVGIDNVGLDKMDREYLFILHERFSDGPAGVAAMASVMNVEESTLDSVVEPWLLRLGFIQRTPRGRVLTEAGKDHLRL